MQDKRAIPTLTAVLKDTEQDTMVRHEAGTQTHTRPDCRWCLLEKKKYQHSIQGFVVSVVHVPHTSSRLIVALARRWFSFPSGEALGAIGDPVVLDLLREYVKDPVVEVRAVLQL